ncbi:transposase IS66 [Geobacillus stearothermophilus]|uniref:Transposase IS66 n=1 Tax=Geobacillus stearothermophilus TaxID=1422 RepID=A0ABQ7HJJ2_GEOSE|nr:transposase IS66 [Geobacillus stearothermophilus]
MTEMIEALFGHSMSVKVLIHMVKRGYESIRPSIQTIGEALLDSLILHVDETSMRINGTNF